MWRLALVGLIALAVVGVGYLLPGMNGEEQLRSLTTIATQGSDAPTVTYSEGSASPELVAEAAAVVPRPAVVSAEALRPMSAVVEEAGEDVIVGIQKQLRRVGCLKVNANGRWDATTRRAMARFNDRVNARMSLDHPSKALLALVESYANRACGAACSPGSEPDASGVCVERQIEAKAPAQPMPAEGKQVAALQPAPVVPAFAAPVIAQAAKPVAPVIEAKPAAARIVAPVSVAKVEPVKPVVPVVVATVEPAKPVVPAPAKVAVATTPSTTISAGGNDWAPTVVASAPQAASAAIKPAPVVTPLAKSVQPVAPKSIVPAPAKPAAPQPVIVAKSEPAPAIAAAPLASATMPAATAIAAAPPQVVTKPADVAALQPDAVDQNDGDGATTSPSSARNAPVARKRIATVAKRAVRDVRERQPVRTARQAAPPKPKRTQIAIVDNPRKKKAARKSSGFGEQKFAFGGSPKRVKKKGFTSSFDWLTKLFGTNSIGKPKTFVNSAPRIRLPKPRRAAFTGASIPAGGAFGGSPLSIVLSKR